jgi:hypothetical protein
VDGMLIAEDLLLLQYEDLSGKAITGNPGLDYSLAGAVLVELTQLGKVAIAVLGDDVKAGRLKVLDTSSTGDAILDQRLALLAGKSGQKPQNLVGKLSKGLRHQVLARLVERGILVAKKDRVLGLFPVTRWPAKDARRKAEVRTALGGVLKLGAQPDERAASLIALLSAADAVPKVITDAVDKKALKRRAKEIAGPDWAAEAVRKAIQARRAADSAASTAGG